MKVKLSIGDWSKDGHNHCEIFVYEVNKSVKDIREAYKNSCLKTGIQFNNAGDNYLGVEIFSWGSPMCLCVEYQDSNIPIEIMKTLNQFGLAKPEDIKDDICFPDEFAELIMQFIQLSLPELTWGEAAFKRSELPNIEPINGWWNPDLNVSFGYGLFD